MSVRVMCYNQEDYIAQAIDSILMQKTSFDMEIVIGDDFSDDGTLRIIRKYEKQYPHIIRILEREKGDIYYQSRIKFGRLYNFVDILKRCRGDYIALLDGDDFWADPLKVQKQADFLDSHPECAICFHPVKVISDEDLLVPSFIPINHEKQISTIEDLVVENFIPSCSTMFRSRLFESFPDWFYSLNQGDWSLHILNAQHGDIGYIDENMAICRMHSGGVWNRTKLTERIEAVIGSHHTINKHLKYKYRKFIKPKIAEYYFELYTLYKSSGEIEKARVCLLKYIFSSFQKREGTNYTLFVLAAKLYVPFLFKITAYIRKKLQKY